MQELLGPAGPRWRRSSRSVDPGSTRQQYLDSAALEDPGLPARSGEEKPGSDLTAKLLLLDQLVHLENDVIETKRKRSFTGGSAPLDRLSISNVDLGKQGKQRKVETPRRRVSAPIDRVGAGRLPSTRG
ncbi:hypothetical protein MATL_G00120300 [Megalops atlanticus]|uniref:Osteocrin n=1 Tax=Megalops atlanticus TaxID=7932 RepID=A0A9D3Q2W1_MEGAT|nr:hypothetical protein MATL_G00120300 [Megalops atlanticus]